MGQVKQTFNRSEENYTDTGPTIQFSSVHLHSHVWLLVTPWTAAWQASLSRTNTQSSLRLTSIESVKPSSHLILCHPLLLLPLIFPSIRVFSNESALCTRWPKYWSFSFKSVLPMNTQDWSPLRWTGWISLQSKELSRVFSNTTVWLQGPGIPELESVHHMCGGKIPDKTKYRVWGVPKLVLAY